MRRRPPRAHVPSVGTSSVDGDGAAWADRVDPHRPLFVDQDQPAATEVAAVDVQLDGFIRRRVEVDDGSRGQRHGGAHGHPAASELCPDAHRNGAQRLGGNAALGHLHRAAGGHGRHVGERPRHADDERVGHELDKRARLAQHGERHGGHVRRGLVRLLGLARGREEVRLRRSDLDRPPEHRRGGRGGRRHHLVHGLARCRELQLRKILRGLDLVGVHAHHGRREALHARAGHDEDVASCDAMHVPHGRRHGGHGDVGERLRSSGDDHRVADVDRAGAEHPKHVGHRLACRLAELDQRLVGGHRFPPSRSTIWIARRLPFRPGRARCDGTWPANSLTPSAAAVPSRSTSPGFRDSTCSSETLLDATSARTSTSTPATVRLTASVVAPSTTTSPYWLAESLGRTVAIDRYGQISEMVDDARSSFTSIVSTRLGSLGGARWIVLICDSSSVIRSFTPTSSSQVTVSDSSSELNQRRTIAISISVSSRGLVTPSPGPPRRRSISRSTRPSSVLIRIWVPRGSTSTMALIDGCGACAIAVDQTSWSTPRTSISTAVISSADSWVDAVRQKPSCARSRRRCWSWANLLGREKSMSRTRRERRARGASFWVGAPCLAASTSAATWSLERTSPLMPPPPSWSLGPGG